MDLMKAERTARHSATEELGRISSTPVLLSLRSGLIWPRIPGDYPRALLRFGCLYCISGFPHWLDWISPFAFPYRAWGSSWQLLFLVLLQSPCKAHARGRTVHCRHDKHAILSLSPMFQSSIAFHGPHHSDECDRLFRAVDRAAELVLATLLTSSRQHKEQHDRIPRRSQWPPGSSTTDDIHPPKCGCPGECLGCCAATNQEELQGFGQLLECWPLQMPEGCRTICRRFHVHELYELCVRTQNRHEYQRLYCHVQYDPQSLRSTSKAAHCPGTSRYLTSVRITECKKGMYGKGMSGLEIKAA